MGIHFRPYPGFTIMTVLMAAFLSGLGVWQLERLQWKLGLIADTDRRGIPLLLLNGRMSVRSFKGWQRMPGLIGPLLACFELCLAQDAVQAERLRRLGAAGATSVGDLKAAAAPLPCGTNWSCRVMACIGRVHTSRESGALEVP